MPNIWDRQDAEPNMWYDRFVRYYLSKGSGRSVQGAYNDFLVVCGRRGSVDDPPKDAPLSWRNNADKWDWIKRAEAWDAEQRRLKEVVWEQRRQELEERDWEIARQLTDKVKAMLNFPVSEQHIEQDGKHITIYPAKWGQRDVAQIAKTASEMARLAAGLATDRKETRDVSAQAETLDEWKAARAVRDAQTAQMMRDFEET